MAVGPKLDLDYTESDARDFAALFAGQASGNRLFKQVSVITLLGDQATKTEIEQAVEHYDVMYRTENLHERDVLVLFFSTHGAMHDGRFYLKAEGYQPVMYRSTALQFEYVREILDAIPCKKLVLIDACQSGGARYASAAEINQALNVLDQARGTSVLVSSSETEYSYEDARWQNGAFTEALLEGLAQGRADSDANSIITLGELSAYVQRRVPQLALQIGKQQHPRLASDQLGGDMPLFLRR
ncbi:MAG: hypothetical protein OHK0039_31510 [Bacteroidia bacterium]